MLAFSDFPRPVFVVLLIGLIAFVIYGRFNHRKLN